MNWGGFSGTDEALMRYLKELKTWAEGACRRRRRPEMAEDFESLALELLVEGSRMGEKPDAELERVVAKRLDLADNFSTARDSDLSAGLEDFDGSYIEEFVLDADDSDPESLLIQAQALQAGEEREEGKDLEEIVQEIDRERAELTPIEDQILTLRHLWHYRQKDIASYIGRSQGHVSIMSRRSAARLKGKQDLKTYKARAEADSDFTKLEVAWITL